MKKSRILLIIFLLSINVFNIYSQDKEKKDRIGNVGIALNVLGISGLYGATVDLMVAKRAIIEVGYGLSFRYRRYYGTGVNIFFKKIDGSKKAHFYTGLKYSGDFRPNTFIVYAPIGMMLFNKNKFFFRGIDIGPSYRSITNPRETRYSSGIYGNLKIGFRF
jgi:hypothetical protein